MSTLFATFLFVLCVCTTNAFYRLCTDCEAQEIWCPDNEHCTIDCNADDNGSGCKNSFIFCPRSAHKCNVNCLTLTNTTYYSCESLTIDAVTFNSNNTELNVRAEGHENIFQSGQVLCPSHASCNILCLYPKACLGLFINASSSTYCNISLIAHGSEAFTSGTIQGGAFSRIYLECNGYKTCRSTITTHTYGAQLNINATGDNVLTNSSIYCPNNYADKTITCYIDVKGIGALQSTSIYASESFYDLYFLCDPTYTDGCSDTTLVCDNGTSSCSIQLLHDNIWQCIDETSKCQTFSYSDICSQFADDPRNSDIYLLCRLFQYTNVFDMISTYTTFSTETYCQEPWEEEEWQVSFDFRIDFYCTNETNWITRFDFDDDMFGGELITSLKWPQYTTQIDLENDGDKSSTDRRYYGVWNWSTVTQLNYLFELDIENNNFTGTIENSDWNNIASMPQLEELVLAENYFKSNLSQVKIRNVSVIQKLYLQDNLLYGSLDTSINGFFSKFPDLRTFYVSDNDLAGHFKDLDGLSLCERLRYFRIDNNRFSGSLTLSNRNLSLPTGLSRFIISDNDFNGEIDWQIFAHLTHLDYLLLSNNDFEGTIDWLIIGDLSHHDLDNIALQDNNFSGYVDFQYIDSNLGVRLDTNIICNPSRYVCSYTANPTNRSDNECRGKTDCESTCMCSDGLTAFIASKWNIYAVWSSLFLFVTIHIDMEYSGEYQLKHINDDDCNIEDIFDEETVAPFVYSDIICWYEFRENNNLIFIDFAHPLSTYEIQQMSDLSIKENIFLYSRDDTMEHWIQLNQRLDVSNNWYPNITDTSRIFARWSPSFLVITVYMEMVYDGDYELQYNEAYEDGDCSLFDEYTLYLIGNNNAICSYESNSIIIDLPNAATINLNDSIVIRENVFSYKHSVSNDLRWIKWSDKITLDVLYPDTSVYRPGIIVTIPNQIGVCNDLILDARSSTNLGGREALFVWNIYMNTYFGEYVIIHSDDLQINSDSFQLLISVNITNWYKASSFETYIMAISHNIIPIVYLYGIHEYVSINNPLNDKINIYSTILFDAKCDYLKQNIFDYKIQWFVDIKTLNDVIIDDLRLASLRAYLSSKQEDMISIEPSLYIQNGISYTFTINIKHQYGDYDINATHSIQSLFSDLKCNIVGGDILLNTAIAVDFFVLQPYKLKLDAKTLSYDPDQSSSHNHLIFEWQCYTLYGADCDYLIADDSKSVTYVLFDQQLNYSTFYSFTFVLNISDQNNIFREECIDQITLKFRTMDANTTNTTQPFPLIIDVIAIKDAINTHDKIRLMANVLNYEYDDDDDVYIEHQWTEINSLWSNDLWMECQQTDTSLNLILEQNCIQWTAGDTYSFQLNVSFYDDDAKSHLIAFGTSSLASISILHTPKVTPNSLELQPNSCSNGYITYSSIQNMLSSSFTLSVNADSDYGPLLYQFYWENDDMRCYLHPSLRSESYIDNIYLPIGNITIFVNVYDSQPSMITESTPCFIELQSTSCVSNLDFVMANSIRLMTSDYDIYSFILQQSVLYLQYLQHMQQQQDCLLSNLESILHILDSFIHDVCFNDFQVLLTQTFTLWMQIVSETDVFVNYFYGTQRHILSINNLIISSLDPCYFISMNITYSHVDQLTISPDSIVTNIIKIYFNSNEITSYLPTIAVNPNYHHLLFSFSSELVDVLDYLSLNSSFHEYVYNSYNLLSSALYISSLSSISLSIPGETTFIELDSFSIYNTRISDSNQDINISIKDVDILIPNDITNINNDNSDNIFSSVDIIISVVNGNTSKQNVTVSLTTDDLKCAETQGIVSKQALSISVLANGTNSTHLSSNINFTFPGNERTSSDSYECVWYNKNEDKWQTDGCVSVPQSNDILCSCSHLTTFATIHNIHSYKCDQDNDFIDEWLKSNEWNGINICLALIFLFIFVFTVREVYPFFKAHKKITLITHRSVFAMILIGITAFLYVLLYIDAYLTRIAMRKGVKVDISIKIYTLLLLLPQITLFMLFTLIFYSWFILAHSFLTNLDDIRRRTRYSLLAINIFIWCFLIVYYALVLSGTRTVFEIAAYIWSVMLSISAIFITIYAVLVGKVLYEAARISQHQSFAAEDLAVARRLLIINAFITLYFIFQAFTTIYLAIAPQYQTVIYSTSYSFVDALCLLFIFWMYRSSVHHLRKEEIWLQTKTKSGSLPSRYPHQPKTVNSDPTPRKPITPMPTVSFQSEDSDLECKISPHTSINSDDDNIEIVYDDKIDDMDPDDDVNTEIIYNDNADLDNKHQNVPESIMTVNYTNQERETTDIHRDSLMKNDFSDLSGLGGEKLLEMISFPGIADTQQ